MKNKNTLKKWIVFTFALVIVMISCLFSAKSIGIEKIEAYFSVFEYPTDFTSDKLPFSIHNYNTLSDIEKKAYICIFNNIESHPEYIKIPELTKEEFNNVYFAVKNDNPDMLCFNDSCTMVLFWSACFVQPSYDNSVDECNQKREVLLKKVESVVSEMPEFNDDFSKELYIHDYIISNCSYRESSLSSTAYGCLIEGEAVCSGYSRAAMLLLNAVEIDSKLVAGIGHSPSQGEISHMWNIVWIENESYHLDVTWDDPDSKETEMISHLYFNLSDVDISYDHSDFDTDVSCSSDKYNYFVYNSLYFDSYSQETVDTIKLKLLNNITNGINYVEFEFSDSEAYKIAVEALIDDNSQYSDIYDILKYLLKYVADKVDISHINFSCDDNKKYIKMMFDFL